MHPDDLTIGRWERRTLLRAGALAAAGVFAATDRAAAARRLRAPTISTEPLAAPVASPAATPGQAANEGVLLQATTAMSHRGDGVWVEVGRLTFSPGSSFTHNDIDGPMLLYVETGIVTIQAQGTVYVGRGGQASPEPTTPVAAGTVAALSPGDRILIPGSVVFTWSNATTAPTTALDMTNFDPTTGPGSPGPGIAIETLIGELRSGTNSALPAMARITLRRQALAPGQRIAPPSDGTLQWVGPNSLQIGLIGHSSDGTVTNNNDAPVLVVVMTIEPAGGAGTPVATPAA